MTSPAGYTQQHPQRADKKGVKQYSIAAQTIRLIHIDTYIYVSRGLCKT